MRRELCAAVAAAMLLGARGSAAQDTARTLPSVEVVRDRVRAALELPYGITSVRPDSLAPGQTHTQVDQTLALIPGLTTANRTNPSQDTRVSMRGFGARSAFGVRSVRVLRDGIPLTLPDGQTPIDYLDLEGVGRVEAIRGSAASLYGNASGGVIDLRSSAPPSGSAQVQGRAWVGSYGAQRLTALVGGSGARGGYSANVGITRSDGYRAHARQRLVNGFARAATVFRGTDMSMLVMGLDMPLAENPGALTRAQFDSAPRMADIASVTKNARKEVRQLQVGGTARRDWMGDGELSAQLYGGGRHLFNPLTFALVGVERRSGGASVRATLPLASRARVRHRLTFGADAQLLSDDRKNWANCNGVAAATASCQSVGMERGVLQLDQRERVSSVGPYVRDELTTGRLHVTAGARMDRTKFDLHDRFVADGSDDSGDRIMTALSPMGGVAITLTPRNSAYANIATAFETPTTTELGNQADGSAGLNADLRPQFSTTTEAGMRGVLLTGVRYDVALYETRVRDELIPFDIGNGRTAFRNAGRTRRRGAEVGVQAVAGPLTLSAAYTHSHFRFVDFLAGTVNQAGHTIPGVPEHQLQSALTWRWRPVIAVAEWQARSRVYVNDANAAAAAGYGIVNVRLIGTAMRSRPWLTPVISVQNVLDRSYAGSVAINAAGSATTAKFYEPAAGRTVFIGVSAATVPW